MITTPADRSFETVDPFAADYHPTFTANGYWGARVPAQGQGHSEMPVETQFALAGFYAADTPAQERVGLPAWTGLRFSDGAASFDDCFSPGGDAAAISGYRQRFDPDTGAISTSARWRSPGGGVYDLVYTVLVDRGVDRRALIRLEVTAQHDAEVVVDDLLDTRPTRRVAQFSGERDAARARISLTTTLRGSGLAASLCSVLRISGAVADADGRAMRIDEIDGGAPGSMAQSLRVRLRAGTPVSITKYVGLSLVSPAEAIVIAEDAARSGADAVVAGNADAWAQLWAADIRVSGDDELQRQILASRFSLLASVRHDRPWSPSPAGLSSDGYGGHVFWDTETWMWPALVLQHPEIAAAVLQYRSDRVDEAGAAARAGGDRGIRFPWEGAWDGAEHTPAIEFGETELHVISDVALACWQYYLATGDDGWLDRVGEPIITGAADFWAGRAESDDDGALHIRHVTPPDEWAQAHDDSAYTNVAAARVAAIAIRTAEILGRAPGDAWGELTERMHVPVDRERGIVLEHADYRGERVKQADVVMLTYPWEHDQPAAVTARNLDYYASKVTEWGGPSMTDAMHSIVSCELGRARDAFWYTRRSAAPFLRPPFAQFAEERDGGAFTFVTGAGGFLQEFLYGYSGLRLREDGIALRPLLPGELESIELTALRYRGSVFDVSIGHDLTRITVHDGPPLTVHADDGPALATVGEPLLIPTRRSVDSAGDRGHGLLVARAERPAGPSPAPIADGSELFAASDFEVTAAEVFRDGDDVRFVTTVAGQVSNPWAGEGMSAHAVHVYIGAAADAAPAGTASCLPGIAAQTPAPWSMCVVASGLTAEPATGVYDAAGRRIAAARVTVHRRSEISVTVPAAIVGDIAASGLRAAVVVLDLSDGRTDRETAPVKPRTRVASALGVDTMPAATPGRVPVLPFVAFG